MSKKDVEIKEMDKDWYQVTCRGIFAANIINHGGYYSKDPPWRPEYDNFDFFEPDEISAIVALVTTKTEELNKKIFSTRY